MAGKYTLLLSLAALLALSGASRAGDDKQKSDTDRTADRARFDGTAQEPRQRQDADAPEGFVLIEERLIYVLANEPQLHMASALAKLAREDNRGAAEEVRIAADYMEMQRSRGNTEVSQMLDKQSSKLRKLADKIEAGELKDREKLSKSFARANLELAKHHNALAKSFLQSQRYVSAGHDLSAAGMCLKQAVVWQGEQPEPELVALINNIDHVSRQLRSEAVAERIAGTDDAERAQPAGAREPPEDQPGPIGGTSEAEAQNIVEHARDITKLLEQRFDRIATKLSESSPDPSRDEQDRQD